MSAIVYNPVETLIGMAMTATGVPVYLWIHEEGTAMSSFGVSNAFGTLERVIMHRPGPELATSRR